MKNFRNLFLFVFVCLTLSSSAQSGYSFQTIHSGKDGSPLFSIPLPSGWQVVGASGTGQPMIQGPQGIVVTSATPETYLCDVSPQAMQAVQMTGSQVANQVPLETILRQGLQPAIQQQGGRFIRSYPLPQLKRNNDERLQMAAQSGGQQFVGSEMMATEWDAPGGKKSLIILITFKIRSTKGFSVWGLCVEELEAPAQIFDQAKETYLYALRNMQFNGQAIAARGAQHRRDLARIEAEGQARLNASAAAHQRRMRDIHAAGAANASVNRTGEDILDIQMQGYKNRSTITSTGQAGSVNGIHGEVTLSNPYGGPTVQAEHGSKRYFVDPYGNVHQTDDMFFSPERSEQYRHYREVTPNR